MEARQSRACGWMDKGGRWRKGVDAGTNGVKAVISSHPWRDPCHLPRWAQRILPAAPFGPCCLWGFYLFDPSGLFGPFCLCPLSRRRRDQSLCLSLCLRPCLYRQEKELFDKDVQGGPRRACGKVHYRL